MVLSTAKKPRVAYQGVPGAYSEQACLAFLEEPVMVGFRSFKEAFQAASAGECDFACLPVENSLAGSINQTFDLLTDSDLRVVGERIVHVHHNLLAIPGTKLSEVRRVYSHPQALAQCSAFLRSHRFEAVTDFDTAGAAKTIAENGSKESGAIAGKRAAEIYGLKVLESNIEDFPFNFTRFFILGQDEQPRSGEHQKSSLVLATRHVPGALHSCLAEFPKYGVNMTKLESRPRRDRPWSYLFYVDIEGHIEDENVRKAITGLTSKAAFVKFLGSYEAAPTLG